MCVYVCVVASGGSAGVLDAHLSVVAHHAQRCQLGCGLAHKCVQGHQELACGRWAWGAGSGWEAGKVGACWGARSSDERSKARLKFSGACLLQRGDGAIILDSASRPKHMLDARSRPPMASPTENASCASSIRSDAAAAAAAAAVLPAPLPTQPPPLLLLQQLLPTLPPSSRCAAGQLLWMHGLGQVVRPAAGWPCASAGRGCCCCCGCCCAACRACFARSSACAAATVRAHRPSMHGTATLQGAGVTQVLGGRAKVLFSCPALGHMLLHRDRALARTQRTALARPWRSNWISPPSPPPP